MAAGLDGDTKSRCRNGAAPAAEMYGPNTPFGKVEILAYLTGVYVREDGIRAEFIRRLRQQPSVIFPRSTNPHRCNRGVSASRRPSG